MLASLKILNICMPYAFKELKYSIFNKIIPKCNWSIAAVVVSFLEWFAKI